MTVESIPLEGTRVRRDATGRRQDLKKKQTGRRPYPNKGLLASGPSALKAVEHDTVAEAEAPHSSTFAVACMALARYPQTTATPPLLSPQTKVHNIRH